MNSPETLSAAETAKPNRIAQLAEQLHSLRDPRSKGYWVAYSVAFCYGVIAFMQGWQFLTVYGAVLVVVMMLDELGVRRVERQIDSVVDALRELEKKRVITMTTPPDPGC